jgi:uncharacterized iron-regulated membrane protein
MFKNFHYTIRKSHRYLGLIIGIQFMAWTVSGLYFSWSDLDEVHGDPQKKAAPLLPLSGRLVAPDSVWRQVPGDSLVSLQLMELLGQPVYQLTYLHGPQGHKQVQLADARTGQLRGPLTEAEAVALARSRFNGPAHVASVEYLTQVGNHHEYRGAALPAYAVSFDQTETPSTVYVSAELGTVVRYRNRAWRIFDFLWMGHTMDYQGRDNFNNWLLRIFSVFGVLTVLSGFVLYYVSSRAMRRPARTKPLVRRV